VLNRLLGEPVEIVALSGTSGGAVCATLAWRGLLAGDRDDAVRRLEAFWDDNASEALEALWEGWFRLSARLVGDRLARAEPLQLRLGCARAVQAAARAPLRLR
jgi:NTE family protein